MNWFIWIYCISCSNQTLERDTLIPPPEILSLSSLDQEMRVLNYAPIETIPNGYMTSITTDFGIWKLSIQHFQKQEILYIAINDYLWLDQAQTTQETVFTLTQLATRNHDLLGAKLQLNPQNGAITISTEITIGSGVERKILETSINRLLTLAKEEYPLLKASLGISRY